MMIGFSDALSGLDGTRVLTPGDASLARGFEPWRFQRL